MKTLKSNEKFVVAALIALVIITLLGIVYFFPMLRQSYLQVGG